MTHRAWIVDAVGAALFDRLAAGLAGSELQSLLLEVTNARAQARSPKELVAQYGRDTFCAPARVDLRVQADLGPLEHPYYSSGLRYRIWVAAPDGEELPLGDGGTFDWLGRLAANRRAVFVGSGLGSQLIALRFAPGRLK